MQVYLWNPKALRILAYNPDRIDLLAGDIASIATEEISLAALLSAAEYLTGNDQLPLLIASKDEIDVKLLRQLRSLGFSGPILTGSNGLSPSKRINWRYAGADDVLKLPADSEELRARLAVVERRLHGVSGDQLQIGPLNFYLDGRNPEVAGQAIHLSSREYNILRQLALNSGRVVSKSAIYDALYALAADQPFDKIIDVYICRLRAKIGKASQGVNFIETVSGRGYRLNVPQIAA